MQIECALQGGARITFPSLFLTKYQSRFRLFDLRRRWGNWRTRADAEADAETNTPEDRHEQQSIHRRLDQETRTRLAGQMKSCNAITDHSDAA